MLAQLQKIEVEGELCSLRRRLKDMTDKYSRAMAERNQKDKHLPKETQEDVNKELGRAVRTYKDKIAKLEESLVAEQARCQNLRSKLDRQARDHQLALAEATEKLLGTQPELDKVKAQHALEEAQFALCREKAKCSRLERKCCTLEGGELISSSISPPGGRQTDTSVKTSLGDTTKTLPSH